MQQRSITVVLANRQFLALWLAQAISQTAQNIINFTLMVVVEHETSSSIAVSLIILAFALPAVAFSAVAGVFVDRWDKKTVLIVTNGLRGLVVLGFLLAQPAWATWQVILFYVFITLVFSSISQFFSPAEGAMIPAIVQKGDLIAANSLFNLTFIAAQLVGFALVGPVLILTIGEDSTIILIFVLYMICTSLVMLLPKTGNAPRGTEEVKQENLTQVWHELRDGLRFIIRDRAILGSILQLSLSSSLFLMLAAIGPGFMTRVVGISAQNFGFLLLPGGIGMILGIIMVNRLAHRVNRELMINTGVVAFGLVLVVLALIRPAVDFFARLAGTPSPLSPVLLSIMVLGLFFGMAVATVSIPAQTVLQERSPEAMRGRVLASFYMVSNAFSIVPILFAGALGDLIGILQVMIIIGLIALFAGGISLYISHRQVVHAAIRNRRNGK